MELYLTASSDQGLRDGQIMEAITKSLAGRRLKKVLLLPPDFTRFYSNAGLITRTYYHMLEGSAQVDVMPAIGTHEAMSREQCREMFGDIPDEHILHHNWRKDVIRIGEVPGSYIQSVTGGLWSEPVSVEVDHRIMDSSYDLIISIGQVVPHEVIGMANHSKNIFVGCGGPNIINSSHMIGAVYGMERMMGKDMTPVRKVLDYSAEHFLRKRPILYVLTVTTTRHQKIITHGLFIGEKRKAFEEAVALSQKKNIDFLDRGIQKCVVYLEPKEFRSSWLGNKAIYRTRMAIQDGGELIVLAPGVTKFGEDPLVDKLIRKYGYCGRTRILQLFQENDDLKKNMGAAAHLIHGSSDGRFRITYAVKGITKAEVESVMFHAADYDEMIKKYDPEKLKYGWNTLDDGEEIFFISNPALGLWIDKTRF